LRRDDLRYADDRGNDGQDNLLGQPVEPNLILGPEMRHEKKIHARPEIEKLGSDEIGEREVEPEILP